MRVHYRERLELADFSRVIHYSPRHLSRRFKADLGLSLFEYLRLYRIARGLPQKAGKTMTRDYRAVISYFFNRA